MVEGGGVGGVTVTSGKVNAHCEIDLTSSKYVLKKRVAWCYLLVYIRIVIVSHGPIRLLNKWL